MALKGNIQELKHEQTIEQVFSGSLSGLSITDKGEEVESIEMQGAEIVGGPDEHGVSYVDYKSEHQLPDIMQLMKAELSEPYSVYTYRYFIHQWPQFTIMVVACMPVTTSLA